MLAKFSVQNFRSIKDQVSLSMVAYAPDKTHPEALQRPAAPDAAPVKKPVDILKTAAIYGPNNAGKSNLFRAGFAMRQIILTSAMPVAAMQGANALQTWIQPFRLDAETADAPTTFEVTFFLGQSRYAYGFTADYAKIHEEWLYVWPTGSGKPQTWLERTSPEYSEKTWRFGSALTGMTKSAQKAYEPHVLFLSVASTLKNEKLAPIVDWLINKFHFMDATPDYTLDGFKAELERDPKFMAWASTFLKWCNLRIDSLDLLDLTMGAAASALPAEMPEPIRKQFQEQQRLSKLRVHIPRTIQGAKAPPGATMQAYFDLENDESKGTRRIAVLLPMLYFAIQNGATLWIDELETSLHVLQAKMMIELMQTPEFNPKGAQLIFTSHQALLLDPAIFRRDQIYLMDCDNTGASNMCSLLDFKARKGEAWCKGYITGRYGAVPSLVPLIESTAPSEPEVARG